MSAYIRSVRRVKAQAAHNTRHSSPAMSRVAAEFEVAATEFYDQLPIFDLRGGGHEQLPHADAVPAYSAARATANL